MDSSNEAENTTFKSWFEIYYSPLCNFAFQIVKDHSAAEDIVQELFIQLWDEDKIKEIKEPEHFLIKATKYKCIDYLRKNKKLTIPLHLLGDISDKASASNISEENIEPLLAYFISKLPPKTKEIFQLKRQSGLTNKEIALEKSISVKTVENQMTRALKLMRTVAQRTGSSCPHCSVGF